MPLRKLAKIAKTVDAAMRDADRARNAHSDPRFGRDLQKDRRGTLRKFDTVEHALQDREKIERSKAAKAKKK